MTRGFGEDLSRYVSRTMREKHLSQSDVCLRSGNRIKASYISAIIQGTASNLSVEKLKALAAGLKVDEMELIRVAFGITSDESPRPKEADDAHTLVLLDMSRKLVMSSDIAELVGELMKLSYEDRAVVLQFVRRLNKTHRRAQRKSG
jgi:transcriptional regulator with XRE-family HTH domain